MYRFSIALANQNDERHGISNLELTDGCFGAPLWELSPEQLEEIRDRLIYELSRVVLYTVSLPVREQEKYVRLLRAAHLLNVENLHLTYAAVEGASQEEIQAVIRMAEAFSIRVLFCIEAAHIEQFDFEAYRALRGENTGLIFDPSEFVRLHKCPFLSVLYKLKFKDDIVFLRVNDMLYDSLTPMLPEHGNSEIKECASNLLVRSFSGYFSFAKYGDEIDLSEVISAFCSALCNL